MRRLLPGGTSTGEAQFIDAKTQEKCSKLGLRRARASLLFSDLSQNFGKGIPARGRNFRSRFWYAVPSIARRRSTAQPK